MDATRGRSRCWAAASSAPRSRGCCTSRPTTSPRASGAASSSAGVAVRRLGLPRDVDLPAELFTTDAEALVTREDVDVVVEVIGGIEPARSLILAALEHGASVVTANKALLAEDGSTLFAAAEKAGRDLYYEAAVAGAIPILRPLRESLAGDQVTPGARHRQRHHQLHPRPDGHLRRGLRTRRSRRRRRSATPRPTRPPTSRASTPPPRPRSSPASPSTPGSRPPTCTARGSPRSPRATSPRAAEMGCVVKLLAICALENGPTDRRSPPACTRR